MPDDLIDLITSTALEVAADKAERRYRWARLLGMLMRGLFLLLLVAVVVVTFAYW
jgi:type VI protein secretion system component VasK